MTKVSVLMSVYNGERYLREAVESILGQTYTDFELIIVDDGSTDSTWQILTDYARLDSRIILTRKEKNFGLSHSLNMGLSLAQGEYVARQDADDVSLPERLATQVEFMERHPDYVLIGSGGISIDEESRRIGTFERLERYEQILEHILLDNQFTHTAVMFRHRVVKSLGIYAENLPLAQDYDLWLRIALRHPVMNLRHPLVKYREMRANDPMGPKRAMQIQFRNQIRRQFLREVIEPDPSLHWLVRANFDKAPDDPIVRGAMKRLLVWNLISEKKFLKALSIAYALARSRTRKAFGGFPLRRPGSGLEP